MRRVSISSIAHESTLLNGSAVVDSIGFIYARAVIHIQPKGYIDQAKVENTDTG